VVSNEVRERGEHGYKSGGIWIVDRAVFFFSKLKCADAVEYRRSVPDGELVVSIFPAFRRVWVAVHSDNLCMKAAFATFAIVRLVIDTSCVIDLKKRVIANRHLLQRILETAK